MRLITFKGRTLGYRGWAEVTGVPARTIKSRLNNCGWNVEDTLTRKRGYNKTAEYRESRNWYKTHGMTGTALYRVWKRLRGRCENKNNKDWPHYGGRGIKVCKEWSDFECFFADMNSGFKKGLEIDRIDNDGDYCKQNCRWATRREQVRNRRITPVLEIDGVRRSVSEWADVAGVPRCRIKDRIRMGWEAKMAVFAPKKKNKFI